MDPKCKEPGHLRVVLKRDPKALAVGEASIIEVDVLACRNDLGYHGWGATIQPKGRAAGMHLLPESVRMLSLAMPTVAAAARAKPKGWAVSIEHTVKGELVVWKSFVPDLADDMADDLNAIYQEHLLAA